MLPPKGLDLLESFLRRFVTVQSLLPAVEKEGLLSSHLARPEAVLDRDLAVEDPCVGQAFVFAFRPTFRVAANASGIARRPRGTLVADDIVALRHG